MPSRPTIEIRIDAETVHQLSTLMEAFWLLMATPRVLASEALRESAFRSSLTAKEEEYARLVGQPERWRQSIALLFAGTDIARLEPPERPTQLPLEFARYHFRNYPDYLAHFKSATHYLAASVEHGLPQHDPYRRLYRSSQSEPPARPRIADDETLEELFDVVADLFGEAAERLKATATHVDRCIKTVDRWSNRLLEVNRGNG